MLPNPQRIPGPVAEALLTERLSHPSDTSAHQSKPCRMYGPGARVRWTSQETAPLVLFIAASLTGTHRLLALQAPGKNAR